MAGGGEQKGSQISQKIAEGKELVDDGVVGIGRKNQGDGTYRAFAKDGVSRFSRRRGLGFTRRCIC